MVTAVLKLDGGKHVTRHSRAHTTRNVAGWPNPDCSGRGTESLVRGPKVPGAPIVPLPHHGGVCMHLDPSRWVSSGVPILDKCRRDPLLDDLEGDDDDRIYSILDISIQSIVGFIDAFWYIGWRC